VPIIKILIIHILKVICLINNNLLIFYNKNKDMKYLIKKLDHKLKILLNIQWCVVWKILKIEKIHINCLDMILWLMKIIRFGLSRLIHHLQWTTQQYLSHYLAHHIKTSKIMSPRCSKSNHRLCPISKKIKKNHWYR
jgi:hypothetical protein